LDPAGLPVSAQPPRRGQAAGAEVGRDQILVDLMRQVRGHRLVTLTGVGGVGKTRLSVEVAASLADEHPDGVWMVELASLTDTTAVPDAIATTLGITHRGARDHGLIKAPTEVPADGTDTERLMSAAGRSIRR
jgi:Mrp family chromosome partitioning ATPase